MKTKIGLIIPKSSSSNLNKVLLIAKTFNNCSEIKNISFPIKISIEDKELFSRYKDIERIYLLARNWKGTQLLVNECMSDYNGLRKVLEIFRCADLRENAIVPENYCQAKHEHGWGCKRLNMIGEGLPQYSFYRSRENDYWFQFGKFNSEFDVWTIDKKSLLDSLLREAKSKNIDICPFFIKENIENRVNNLPDSISLTNESAWDMFFEEKYDNSTIKKVPVGIKPKHLVESTQRPGLSFSISMKKPEEKVEQKNRNIPEVSFQDIGGVDEIVEMIREVIELPLKHPELIKHLGIRPHKGILLHGVPGCGKTLIAKAIANEIEAHFISIRGPELFTKWFGQSEENLRNVFQEARELSPSIIFFDEIDSIAQKRSGNESVRHESIFVNQLLTLMDGMEVYENVCVIASTNRPELLDDAIMRPGCFDYTLEVKRPTLEGCKKIFQIHTRLMPLDSTVNTNELV